MDQSYYNARRPLVVSIALLALYGLEQERTRLWRMAPDSSYTDSPEILEVQRIVKELKKRGGVIYTADAEILARLAHARHTAKIPLEEWEVVIRVERPLFNIVQESP